MARHRSRYLWTAMKEWSRKPAEATRRMNAWDPGGGWRIGAGRRRLAAMLFGQPAEPEEGELGGQFSLEGADAGSEGAQGIHMGFTS